jgi:hypothetical protein
MKKLKVILAFIQFSVVDKISFYRNVIIKLTGNALFMNPDEPLSNAQMIVDKLEASYLASMDGSHTAVSAMHADELVADQIFRTLAAYVQRIADGDETKILCSGFHVSKQPVTTQKAMLAVKDGPHSGSVKLIAKAVDRAGSYIWQSSLDGIKWIVVGNSTSSTFLLSRLTEATKYYFRVAAVTPEGVTDFTAAVLKVVV